MVKRKRYKSRGDKMILKSLIETIYMVFISMFIGTLIGFPLGIILSVSKKRVFMKIK